MKKRNIIFELLAFSSPRAIVVDISIILTALATIPTKLIGSYCIFKNIIFPMIFDTCPQTGIFANCECPACGLTRAFSNLLHGNFYQAYDLNKLIIIIAPLVFVILIYNIYKLFKHLK